jgi:predicted  nucleic acid-binding Zn-ribbon protein
MSATVRVVESNQAFLEKITKENELMVETLSDLRSQLHSTEQAIAQCKSETMAAIEPKIQKLLSDQKTELQRQQTVHQQKLTEARANHSARRAVLEKELEMRVLSTRDECRQRIEKTVSAIQERRAELQTELKFPDSVGEERQKLIAEEEIVREEWERIITDKFQKEFAEKRLAALKSGKAKQEVRILEIIGGLEVATRAESNALERKLEKEKKEHSIYMVKLRKKLDEVSVELEDLRVQGMSEQLDREIEELKAAVRPCQCQQYQQELRALSRQRVEIEEELEQTRNRQKQIQPVISPELEAIKTRMREVESRRVTMKTQIGNLEREIRSRKKETENAIATMEQRHKQQIAAIGERVKQTVTKKDQVIDQLKTKLRECGLIPTS